MVQFIELVCIIGDVISKVIIIFTYFTNYDKGLSAKKRYLKLVCGCYFLLM